MPRLEVKRPEEVPSPARASRAVTEQKRLYESFIQQIGDNVGELELAPEDQIRGVKSRLSRAATRMGRRLEIWDIKGKVYFKLSNGRRNRPRGMRA